MADTKVPKFGMAGAAVGESFLCNPQTTVRQPVRLPESESHTDAVINDGAEEEIFFGPFCAGTLRGREQDRWAAFMP